MPPTTALSNCNMLSAISAGVNPFRRLGTVNTVMTANYISLAVGLILLSCVSAFAQTTIVSEGFETDGSGGSRYTLSHAHSNDGGGEDYFERGTDADFAGFGLDAGSLTGETGSYYMGAEDSDSAPTAVSPSGSVTLNTANVAGYTSLQVKIDMATGGLAKFDNTGTADFFRIEAQIDGGGYSTIGEFRGVLSFNDHLYEDTDLDGVGDGTQLTSTFQTFTFNVGGTGSNLDVRIAFLSSAGDEEIFWDNIIIQGTPGSFITTGAITDPFCVTTGSSDAVSVPFTSGGTFNSGNVYTAQLSDASGSFASPTAIGLLTSTANSGTISANIPAGTASGSAYRIRVVSDNPATTGSDNGVDLTNTLGPTNVSGEGASPASTQVTISWTNPSSCYDEIMVVGRQGSSVTATPSGNGSGYTANSAFGSGTDMGSSQYVIYKGSGTSDVATGLTDGLSYCFKIFVRKGTSWSSGKEVCATPNTATVFDKGDFALVAVNSNTVGCTGGSGDDEISFVCFKDINSGDSFHFTDNGWQRENASQWGSTEGVVRITRTTSTITAGTVITMRITAAGAVSFVSPDANWTSTNEYNAFNLNSGGDQVWFLQNGTWTNTGSAHEDTYSGNILFGFSTNGAWNDFGFSTQESGLYPTLDCFSMAPTGVTDFNKYTGPTTATNQRTWLVRFSDPSNWTSSISCAAYDALAPNYAGGYSISITAGGFTNGIWSGATDTDWFECSNWEDLDVPTITSDVLLESGAVPNEPTIGAAGAVCASLTIESGRTLTINDASSTLQIDGQLTNDGTVSHTAGSVTFSGASATYNGSNAIAFNNLITNKDIGATMTMNNDLTIRGSATFTNGYWVSSNSNEFIFASGTSVSAVSDDSHVDGPVKKIGNTDFSFPIGNGSTHRPASVTSITGGDATTQFRARYYDSSPDGSYSRSSKAGTIDHVSDCEYWLMDQVGGTAPTNATVELSWDDPESCGVTDLSKLGVAWWNGFQWRDQGNAATTGSTTTGTITANVANTSFSPFTLHSTDASPVNPLPIELLVFDARFNGSAVDLDWITQTEINNDYFTIERSLDGREFEAIANITGAGNSSDVLRYTIQDLEPVEGISYYRLKQTDFDGQFTYSGIRPIYVEYKAAGLDIDYVYSDNELVRVYLAGSGTAVTTVEVFDPVGRLVYRKNMTGSMEVKSISLPSHYFASGFYLVKVSNGAETAVSKFKF